MNCKEKNINGNNVEDNRKVSACGDTIMKQMKFKKKRVFKMMNGNIKKVQLKRAP